MTASPPVAVPMTLPDDYGRPPDRLLAWADVSARLASAPRYWLATVRPDGRPHIVPTDGLWVDDALWFGGSTATVHHRNLLADGAAAAHVEDGARAVIVEGTAGLTTPTASQARELAALSKTKYGYAAPPEAYTAELWLLTPSRVLAWTEFPRDATRFTFRRHRHARHG
ncbi:pyridoxamine 5'-phosphate oxidase family protein [Actinoplanes sp. NBC_00393]|uniref:pyridoxamine 5'-phosphate oxidase family protein n=1 Tax=Actinoplanes sp. NBC_00393 TaxID=2975953 RepID=UPI002E2414EE